MTTRWCIAAVLAALGGCAPTMRGAAAKPANGVSDAAAATSSVAPQVMLVRISEIRIDPAQLSAYNALLQEEAEASIRLEPGVIAIVPMYQREHANEVRILEIYASRAAYEAHIKTPHFQKYKTMTLSMVTSLTLIDMALIDPATMPRIFAKLRGGT